MSFCHLVGKIGCHFVIIALWEADKMFEMGGSGQSSTKILNLFEQFCFFVLRLFNGLFNLLVGLDFDQGSCQGTSQKIPKD